MLNRHNLQLLLPLIAIFHLPTTAASDLPTDYRGLTPGRSTLKDVLASLGPPSIKSASATDLRYPVAGAEHLNDRFYFRDGKVALVTAATLDKRYPNRQTIEQRFGPPEAEVLFQTQQYLDYTGQGKRFICRTDGTTTGVLYFAPQKRRVPENSPNASVDLRHRLNINESKQIRASEIRVGVAERNITPIDFDNLLANGNGKRLTVAADLMARVAIFERDGQKVAFAGLDVFGLGNWDIDRLRSRLAEKGFAHVVIAMSHTHANVDTIGFYGHYPAEYARHILDKTEAAVLAAAAKMKAIKQLKTGTIEMPLAGGRVVDLIRNGRDPGLVDPTVSLLQAIGTDGQPVVNVVNLACHPEVVKLEKTKGLSPDFVGTLCEQVTSKLGGQTVFLNGALGGMLTPESRTRTHEAACAMGNKLAGFVVAAADVAVPCESDVLSIRTRSIHIPIAGESVAYFLEHAPGPVDFKDGRLAVELNAIRLGDAQFITIPGELLPDIGFEVIQKMTGRIRAIVSLANGELGYVVPSFDFRDGGYEERTGPGKEAGELIRNTALELAN